MLAVLVVLATPTDIFSGGGKAVALIAIYHGRPSSVNLPRFPGIPQDSEAPTAVASTPSSTGGSPHASLPTLPCDPPGRYPTPPLSQQNMPISEENSPKPGSVHIGAVVASWEQSSSFPIVSLAARKGGRRDQ